MLIEGWKAIAHELGCSTATARRYAEREVDPLPIVVSPYSGRIAAERDAIKAWRARYWGLSTVAH